LPPEPVIGVVDERRFRQILINLLGNAIKFTPQEGAVDLVLDEEEGAILLTVRDTGIGISEDDLRRVLQPFHQVDSSLHRRHDGTGLGLTISERLVRLHGGTLTLESRLGVGTSVTVRLPRSSAVSGPTPRDGGRSMAA
jgi:signal transduction histidine kinase